MYFLLFNQLQIFNQEKKSTIIFILQKKMLVTNVSVQNMQRIEVRFCFLKGEFRCVVFETSVEEILCRAAYSVMSNGRESGWHFVMMHSTYRTSEVMIRPQKCKWKWTRVKHVGLSTMALFFIDDRLARCNGVFLACQTLKCNCFEDSVLFMSCYDSREDTQLNTSESRQLGSDSSRFRFVLAHVLQSKSFL